MLGCSLVAFGLYTAAKAAYLSTVFATRVEERNLIYLCPLLFIATARCSSASSPIHGTTRISRCRWY